LARHIEIALERSDVRCVAELLDSQAPATCEAIWEALPQGSDVFHGKYARNEIYTLVPDFAPADPGLENTTITPIPGDVCAFWFTAEQLRSGSHGYSEGRSPEPGTRVVDLAFFYERNNLLLNPDAGWVPGNVFGTIVEGLEEMAAAAGELWLRGADGERLTFRRKD
jgi:hypothetical protein